MSQSLALVLVHIIFSTKNRMPFLQSAELRSEVHTYFALTGLGVRAASCRRSGRSCPYSLRTLQKAELIKNLKTSSTRIVKGKGHDAFSWQSGSGAFSVSQSARESVFSYIAKQQIHHRKTNFQDEFRALLNKHGIRFEERSNRQSFIRLRSTPFWFSLSARLERARYGHPPHRSLFRRPAYRVAAAKTHPGCLHRHHQIQAHQRAAG